MSKYIYTINITLILFITVLNGQSSIPTVRIGEQEWSSVNLTTDRFLNGDIIPEAKDADEWIVFSKKGLPVRMISKSGEVFYNWHAVIDPRGIAPGGFRIPSMSDWYDLLDYQITNKIPLTHFTSKSGWFNNLNGSDNFGFNISPNGLIFFTGGIGEVGVSANYWSTTDANGSKAYFVKLSPDQTNLKIDTDLKRNGFQIRLIKIPPQTQIGSRKYKTARIGTYEWMTENLDESLFENYLELFEAKSFDDWNEFNKSEVPAWAYYEFDAANKDLGKFYNYYAVVQLNRFSFNGWTVPELKHWENLINHIGGWKNTAHKLRGGNEWKSGTKVSNSSGFNALPTGIMIGEENHFDAFGEFAVWWIKESSIELIGITNNYEDVIKEQDTGSSIMNAGLPMRLVKSSRETIPYSQYRNSEKTWDNDEAANEIKSLREATKGNKIYETYPILLECMISNLKSTHTFDEYRFIAESEYIGLFRELIDKCIAIHKIKIGNK